MRTDPKPAWVQAGVLGLHEEGTPQTVTTLPSLPVFLESEILVPAAKIDDSPWPLDSERILVSLGFSEVGKSSLLEVGRSVSGCSKSWEVSRVPSASP